MHAGPLRRQVIRDIKPFLGERNGRAWGTIQIMHSVEGRHIADESEYPWEEEVVHMPGRNFRIVPDDVGSV